MTDLAPLIVFCAVVAAVQVLVLRPIHVPLYRPPLRTETPDGKVTWRFTPWTLHWQEIGFETPSVIGVIVLLIMGTLTWQDVYDGLAGDQRVHPLTILIVSLTMAYFCLCLDLTGLFAYMAMRVAQMSGGSGRHLFVYFCLLTGLMATFTNNDTVILTFTPVIVYFVRMTDVDPIPFLVGEFFSAHCFAILLYTSNSINIIIAQANGLDFLQFAGWTILPCIGAAVVNISITFAIFHRDIPVKINKPHHNPRDLLYDVPGAIFGSIILLITIGLMCAASAIGVEVWQVTSAAAAVMFLRQCFMLYILRADLQYGTTGDNGNNSQGRSAEHPHTGEPNNDHHRHKTIPPHQQQIIPVSQLERVLIGAGPHLLPERSFTEQKEHIAAHGVSTGLPAEASNSELLQCGESKDLPHPADVPDIAAAHQDDKPEAFHPIKKKLTILAAFSRMPWPAVPFILGMFVLVHALALGGWLELMGEGLLVVVGDRQIVGVFIITALVLAITTLMNNQPMAILGTQVLLQSAFAQQNKQGSSVASSIALVIGANFASNFTLIASLAGIIWARILKQKGISISYLRFARYGLVTMLPTTAVACGLLALRSAFGGQQ